MTKPMTVNAKRCDTLSSILTATLAKSFSGFTVELTAVEPSTGNGIRTLQRIILRSKDRSVSLVVGSVNFVAKTAELRTLGCALDIFQRRNVTTDLRISPFEYVRFIDAATFALGQMDIEVTIEAHVGSMRPPAMLKAVS